MSLTRTHIAFLSIISIFTGLVGPGTHTEKEGLSYLMTDFRFGAYAILICLIIAFAAASMRRWTLYRQCVILTNIGIIFLAGVTITGSVESMKSLVETKGFSWGWIFLIIGSILSIISYRQIRDTEETGGFSEGIDTIIGMVGGLALTCIAIILILSSLSFFRGGEQHDILSQMYGSGEIMMLSGGIEAIGPYDQMPDIDYDRARDQLLISISTGSGTYWSLIHEGRSMTGVLRTGLTPFVLGGTVYARDASRYAHSGGKILLGSRISLGKEAITWKNGAGLDIIHDAGSYSIASTGILRSTPFLSENMTTLVWTEGKSGSVQIMRNGLPYGKPVEKVWDIHLSPRGENVMTLISSGGMREVMRNGTSLSSLPSTYITGSYQSNGNHFIYTTKENGIKKVYHDMKLVSRDLEDVREVFLEREGGSYAFFGKPLGEAGYCLFTRYKGNICDLEGYMNPVLGADGGSIIFAGKKNGKWSIYRNADIIVVDTQYEKSDIRYDYAFFDVTNPRYFLFIEKNNDGKYQYRKNGSLLPGTWTDVSTKIFFGYDGHIITSAKDESGWKIIEL